MLVITKNNDNTSTTYGFDPEHKEEAIGFYVKEYWAQKIQGFTVDLGDDETIVFGVN